MDGKTWKANEEFKASLNGYKRRSGRRSAKEELHFKYVNVGEVPASLDWRKKGAVNAIKDQLQCGSWAFSAVAATGGITKITTGIALKADYPYKGDKGTCNPKKEAFHEAKIKGYENVPANNESALLKAVANQPVSVLVDAGGPAFQFYSSGVFTGDYGTLINHGVTVVGYGTAADGTKYWIVKNCWGTRWGEEGYIRMQRDVGAKEGHCGIALDASYPTA
ncbi:hypothetical protein TIFTF001_023104 [Ficus carica]|uniref:Peptidase C1A papain C-terminal domain-containing protein n=1 Tax=Ficus carica TaxID=3494 RepID=A0AA88AJT0_FICCA|nr:hypothetical protein TIFTF001_023104 [Ficus carica]